MKSGLQECVALLAPQEPGSTLALSSLRSESVKGFVTRVGTRIVKGVSDDSSTRITLNRTAILLNSCKAFLQNTLPSPLSHYKTSTKQTNPHPHPGHIPPPPHPPPPLPPLLPPPPHHPPPPPPALPPPHPPQPIPRHHRHQHLDRRPHQRALHRRPAQTPLRHHRRSQTDAQGRG